MVEKDFLKELFWTSYRYCIGRHSYVSTYAADMAEYFYDKLSDEEKEHNAQDIRREIEDQLHFQPFNFHYDWSVNRDDRRPLEDLLMFINTLEDPKKELSQISSIEAYVENGKLAYEISKKGSPRFEHDNYEHELLDFIPWMDLASLLDVSNHKTVTMKNPDTNELEDVECYESYINESTVLETKGNMTTLQHIPWRYKKVYRPVKHGVSNRFCADEYIVKVQ